MRRRKGEDTCALGVVANETLMGLTRYILDHSHRKVPTQDKILIAEGTIAAALCWLKGCMQLDVAPATPTLSIHNRLNVLPPGVLPTLHRQMNLRVKAIRRNGERGHPAWRVIVALQKDLPPRPRTKMSTAAHNRGPQSEGMTASARKTRC